MKILILSDIHANLEALQSVRETYDELWILGDVVNYGPDPKETIEAVMSKASIVIQGNHDHAVGCDDDSHWSPHFREVAEAARRFTSAQLDDSQKAWLRQLPLTAKLERDGVRFHLIHATPSDPHYGRIDIDDDAWLAELETIDADVLLVGHSHVPFIRELGSKTIVNPGSVGQPRTGDKRASYAVWENGRFSLHQCEYPVEATVEKLKTIGFPSSVESKLISALRGDS